MREITRNTLELTQEILSLLLSGLFLAVVSIIISGKLISARLRIGIHDDASLKIPLGIFKITAKGEEVITGFTSFIFSLMTTVFVGGIQAYDIFRVRSGLDIGHWNSICLMAGSLSLLIATIICIIVPFVRGAPVITESDRAKTLRILEGRRPHE